VNVRKKRGAWYVSQADKHDKVFQPQVSANSASAACRAVAATSAARRSASVRAVASSSGDGAIGERSIGGVVGAPTRGGEKWLHVEEGMTMARVRGAEVRTQERPSRMP
jgi:hypothetical protein